MTLLKNQIAFLGLCAALAMGAPAFAKKDHAAHHPPEKPAKAAPSSGVCQEMMPKMMDMMFGMKAKPGSGKERGMGQMDMQAMMEKHMGMMGAKGMMKNSGRPEICARMLEAVEACQKKGGKACEEAAATMRQRHEKMRTAMEAQMNTLHPKDPRRQHLMMRLEMMDAMEQMMKDQAQQ